MNRSVPGSKILAFLAAVTLVAASALPAAATFDVQERGKTLTVTQLDQARLLVIVNVGGVVVNDGVTVVGYPATTNLVVRGSDALTLSQIEVRLHDALPGSLTLDLPGFNEVELRGTNVTIDGSLKVKGSFSSSQIVRLGETGRPVTIKGDVKLDLRDGYDRLDVVETTTILGKFSSKGLNELRATSLEVGSSFAMDVKRESHPLNVSVLSQLLVGKSFTLTGGSAADNIAVRGGAVGGSVKINLGNGGAAGVQVVQTFFGLVGGSYSAKLGASQQAMLFLTNTTTIKGSVNVAMQADLSVLNAYARVEGTAIKYVGGAGRDIIYSQLVAPRAKASFKMNAGDDGLTLEAPPQLARLDVDFGDGADLLVNLGGFALPPGKIVGLP